MITVLLQTVKTVQSKKTLSKVDSNTFALTLFFIRKGDFAYG